MKSNFNTLHFIGWTFLILLAVFGSGCVMRKACNAKFPPTIITKDSIIERTTVTYRDSIIRDTIPGKSVSALIVPGTSGSKSNGHVHLNYRSTDKGTEVDCIADSLFNEIKVKNKEIDRLKQRLKETSIPVIKYEMPWWGWLLIGIMSLLTFTSVFKLIFK